MNAAELAALTSEQKRVMIAEACGWTQFNELSAIEPFHFNEAGAWGRKRCEIPDYLSSLDAMHEAEKTLTYEQCSKYHAHLDKFVTGEGDYPAQDYWFHATAAQRADAFLLTLSPVSREQPQKTPA